MEYADSVPVCNGPVQELVSMSRPSVRLKNPRLAALLAWLVPGLGHFYQGRIGKGVLYSTCILGLFGLGFYLGDGKIVYWRWVNPLNDPEHFRLYYIGQFFSGLAALPALIQATLRAWGFDTILWGFMAEPPADVLNGLHPKLSKLMEIGPVYTTVAGLLNIFAIYDAYEGPAYSDEDA
jgi:TM2 domain-containing membrane protein YozV